MKMPGWAILERARKKSKAGLVLPPVRLDEMYMENVPEYLQTLGGVARLINNMRLCNELERNLREVLWTIRRAREKLDEAEIQVQKVLGER